MAFIKVNALTKGNVVISGISEDGFGANTRYTFESVQPAETMSWDQDNIVFVDDVLYAIQPYQETCSVTLLEDETKNDDLKRADKLADKGQLVDSYRIFKRVYDQSGYFVAGYNAALLQLAMGNLSQAKAEMQDVYKTSGDQRARDYIDYIDKEIQSAQRLQKQDAARR